MNVHTTVSLVAANLMLDLPASGNGGRPDRLTRIDILTDHEDAHGPWVRKVYDNAPDVIERWQVSSHAIGTTNQDAARDWTLPRRVDTIRAGLGAIWMGAGATIYKVSGNTVTMFSRFKGTVTMDTASLLCLSSNDILDARHDAPLTSPQAVSMTASGRYCADDLNQELYTLTIAPGTLRHAAVRIIPL